MCVGNKCGLKKTGGAEGKEELSRQQLHARIGRHHSGQRCFVLGLHLLLRGLWLGGGGCGCGRGRLNWGKGRALDVHWEREWGKAERGVVGLAA